MTPATPPTHPTHPTLEAARVLAWSAAWIYVPVGAPTVDTADYLLIAHPLSWSDPTGVFRIDANRPAGELVDEVVAAATRLDRTAATFWVTGATRPAGLVEALLGRGAVLLEELAVLARPIASGVPDLDVPGDIEIRTATDLDTLRDTERIGVAVFGGAVRDDDELLAHLHRRDPANTTVEYVAYRDGRPVGTAGLTMAGEVARLWGGSVLEEARGAGVYRALLSRRLADGREHGCGAALVKGRLTTSAPTLRRAGFVQYGEERGYRLTWT